MLRAGIALSLLFFALAAFTHDPFILDARRATNGPRFELIEAPAAGENGGKSYRLRVAPGLPKGVMFGIFTKPFDHAFHEIASGFQLDESGSLASQESGARRKLEELIFGPGPYPAGAVWEAALVSADRSIRIFARAIPYPITASSGACTISLELASSLGDRFVASGSGFPPGEDVATEQRYSGRSIQKRNRVSSGGLLTPELLVHRDIGADRGAHYTVKARTCEVSIDYDWGEPALMRR
jgi:hypothetical protein